MRLTIRGNKLDYCGGPSSPSVSLLDTNIFINSVRSDAHKCIRYGTTDIKHYYLNNPMEDFQYMTIPTRFFTDEIRQECDITNLQHNGFIHVEIHKCMHGLKEACVIAFKRLVKNLSPRGYHPVKHTPGLWRHTSWKIMLTLAVDDFGIKYVDMKDIQHIIASLCHNYVILVNMSGHHYCGLTLYWNYNKTYVNISILGYTSQSLQYFQLSPPSRPQYAPHKWITPAYRNRIQYALPPSSLPLLDKKGTRRVQAINSTIIYYNRAVCLTNLVASNEIAS